MSRVRGSLFSSLSWALQATVRGREACLNLVKVKKWKRSASLAVARNSHLPVLLPPLGTRAPFLPYLLSRSCLTPSFVIPCSPAPFPRLAIAPPCPVRRLVFHRPHPSPRPFSLIPSHSELRFSIVDFPILVHLLAPPRRPFPFPPTPFHRLPFLPHPFPSLRLSPRPAIPAPLIVIPLLFFTWPPHSPSRRVRCRVLSFRLSSHPLPNLACAPRTVPVPHSSKAPPHSAKQFRLVRSRRDGAVEPGIRDRCRKA